MAIFKCKMCGGDLNVQNDATVCECEYCGTKQTLPKLDDEKRVSLYERANHFRRNNEFDKAMGIYEMILGEDNTDAEAYWSIVLCRYGIEYVDDPATHKKVPTVNRAQLSSIFNDADYQKAIANADGYQRDVYEAEAKAIDEIQKGILEISSKEEPFDVFICYKETDSQGRRTHDSVYAQDIYNNLTREGYRVFFSRITLEDKIGTAYEPYIFAALNSAKVMLVVGTSAENLNAVWVKNEWSRYLAIVKQDSSKALIPCYRDMSPYDMPEEFAFLQAQDISKIGFMQDLIHGIKKVVSKDSAVKETVVVNNSNPSVEPLLKRAFMFLEDSEWSRADELCEQVLNQDPECVDAYVIKLLIDLQLNNRKDLASYTKGFENNQYYSKIRRFADNSVNKEFDGYLHNISELKAEEKYNSAVDFMDTADTEDKYLKAKEMFESFGDYKDSANKAEICTQKIAEIKAKQEAERIEQERLAEIERQEKEQWAEFWRQEQKRKAEIERLEKERQAEINRIRKEKKVKLIKKITAFSSPTLIVIIIMTVITKTLIIPSVFYNKAVEYENGKNYDNAYIYYSKAGNYKNSKEKISKIRNKALNYYDIANKNTISVGYNHAVGLKSDRTIITIGENDNEQCNVTDWQDIVAISAGRDFTVGLKSDGTVVAVGKNDNSQCDVSEWKDITAISAGSSCTIGLKSDGTVVAAGYKGNCKGWGECNVSQWKGIISISAGSYHTVGLKADGTVVAVGKNDNSQCDVSEWKDIISISAGDSCTVGLKSDGTVVTAGYKGKYEGWGECKVSDWNDIVSISVGGHHTVGLKSDGTVVAVGKNDDGQCEVTNWNNVVAISAGDFHTFGLKSDGTVVAVGDNSEGQCDVSDWKDIKIPKK